MTHPRETLKEAGFKYVRSLGNGQHVLYDEDNGTQEVWGNSKNFAGYALIYKNTHLEFCYRIQG